MPTTKDQREILAETTEAGATVNTLSVNFSAEFNNEFGGSIVFQDIGGGDPTCDKTKRELSLLAADGTKVADLTAKIVAKVVNLNDFGGATKVTAARETTSPPYSSGRVTLNGSGTGSWLRTWKQTIQDTGGKNVLRNVVKFDIDVEAIDPSYSVSYSVKTQTDNALTLNYSISDRAGPYATGVVTATAAASASGGYTEGPIIVDDDDD